MSRSFLAASVFGLVAVAACTAAPEDVTGTQANQHVGSLGILAVERASGDGTTAPASLGAAFARYQGVDRATVERFLGAGEESGADACALRANDADALVATDANVELVDVGAISVTAGESETRMPPRAFPELARVAGGFFYADDAVVPATTADDGGEYTFRTEGSAEVQPFEVVAPGPPDVADLRVDGAMPSAILRTQGTAITWTAGDPRDEVQIEVQTRGATLVCRARDDGEFAVPSTALAGVGADADARLVVRRVRTTGFDAPGMDAAYVRIAASRQFPLDVR